MTAQIRCDLFPIINYFLKIIPGEYYLQHDA